MRNEIKVKDELIRKFLDKENLDGVLLRRRDNFSWITGGKVNHIIESTEFGFVDLLITKTNKYCIANTVERYRIMEEELDGLGFELITYEWWENDINNIVRNVIGSGKLGCDCEFTQSINVYQKLQKIRYSLLPEEIDRYRELSICCADLVENTCRNIRPNKTEEDVCGEMVGMTVRKGIEPMVALVASDERIFRYRHPIPTKKPIESFALVVLCGRKNGLVSNLTRFVHFGTVPDLIVERRQKVMQIEREMITKTVVGASVANILKAGISMYESVGYADEWKKLHQGGAAGYLTREYLAVPETEESVHINQAFAWNPSIAGAKLEDTFLVTKQGQEFLTVTKNWPMEEIEAKDDKPVWRRPAILTL